MPPPGPYGRLELRFADIRPNKAQACENDWMTPVVYAVLNNRMEMLQYLLDQGADPQVRDDSGQSLLALAAERADPETLQLLQNARAS